MNESEPRRFTRARFDVDFGSFFSLRGQDLVGRGELQLFPTEPILELRGKANGVFPRKAERLFTSSEIRNVRSDGRILAFDAIDSSSAPSPTKRTIRFTCVSLEDAAEICRSLPTETDSDYNELSAFHNRLDALPQAATPWSSVTTILIALNLLAFVVMGFLGAGWIKPASMRPYVEFAANNGAATTQGEWWRLITAMFAHYGIVHLALNMWALFDAGRMVERLLGRLPFAVAYLASGILASFASLLWHQDRTWSAGASGAVFGVFGMLLGFLLKEKSSTPSIILRPILKSVLFFAGYNLLYGFIQPRIDNAAHIGGFISGFGLGWILALPPDPHVRALRQKGRLALAIGATAVLSAVAVVVAPRYDYLFRDRLALERTYSPETQALEMALLHKQASLLMEVKNGRMLTETADWAATVAAPFYSTRADRLEALQLKPGYRSEKDRNLLLRIARSKAVHYQRLARDLRIIDSTALIRFEAAESALAKMMAEEIQKTGK